MVLVIVSGRVCYRAAHFLLGGLSDKEVSVLEQYRNNDLSETQINFLTKNKNINMNFNKVSFVSDELDKIERSQNRFFLIITFLVCLLFGLMFTTI